MILAEIDIGRNEPKLAAVLGNIGDAEFIASRGERTVTGFAVEQDGSRGRGFDAEEGEADIGAARSDQASEAKHLAAVEVESDVLEYALAAEIGHRREQHRFARRSSRGLG